MKAFKTIFKIEFNLELRCMESVFFGIIFPMAVAGLIGMIYGNKPAFKRANYTMLQASFAGIVAVGICATGLMGIPVTISDYRNKKILKWFKVTPVSPVQIIFVQMLICFIVAAISALGVFLVCKFAFAYKMAGSSVQFMLAFILVTISVYSIGGIIASLSPNMKITNLLCNLCYFPMLLLSGATVPYEIFPESIQKVSNVLPLTQGIKILKGISLGKPVSNVMFSIVFIIAVAVLCTAVSVKTFRWE